ncbi:MULTISPECIES: hypothetical protein [Pseudoalteromonas]|uniref:Flagellin n=1 Tax=Pseudoalteromonas obscura TaxID=3048491 RepID=A0ABT7EJW4_9GAMM|nr:MULTISPECIES: hypothetical protein [Pseudoalteromonas]MBQ4836901.1 hypothetical protein [Pseudoalteromonas luteoviolacea]MDK2595333.1 hypothetical protein [Pseudoalteromonas sp. P94(2023)]
MFNKLKETATKNFTDEEGNSQVGVNIKEKGEELTASIKQKATDAKDNLKDISVMNKVKDFTKASVKTVEDIDNDLLASNSQYEINNFRVSATAGVTAGMTLDIHFVKNQGAKEIAQKASRFLIVVNPDTGSKIQVPRSALVNKETAKIKDPKTEAVLTINAKTGAILS